jgi:hypothetical protein
MSSPHTPDHDLDDIVDLTPTGTPDPSQTAGRHDAMSSPHTPDHDQVDIVDLTPTGTPETTMESGDSMDMTPTSSPDGNWDEPAYMTPAEAPRGEPDEADRTTYGSVGREPYRHRAAAPPLEHEDAGKEQDGRRSNPPRRRWKLVVSTLEESPCCYLRQPECLGTRLTSAHFT